MKAAFRGERAGIDRTWKWTGMIALAVSLGACFGASCTPPGESLAFGEDDRVEGRVLEVDATPMFVDGDGEITLQTVRHGKVLIRVPARERTCRARGLDVFSSVEPGDSLRVMGRVTGPREVTVCVEETHVLEKANETGR